MASADDVHRLAGGALLDVCARLPHRSRPDRALDHQRDDAGGAGVRAAARRHLVQPGTEGVGRSANTAVVLSSVTVFVIDLVAVQISDALHLT